MPPCPAATSMLCRHRRRYGPVSPWESSPIGHPRFPIITWYLHPWVHSNIRHFVQIRCNDVHPASVCLRACPHRVWGQEECCLVYPTQVMAIRHPICGKGPHSHLRFHSSTICSNTLHALSNLRFHSSLLCMHLLNSITRRVASPCMARPCNNTKPWVPWAGIQATRQWVKIPISLAQARINICNIIAHPASNLDCLGGPHHNNRNNSSSSKDGNPTKRQRRCIQYFSSHPNNLSPPCQRRIATTCPVQGLGR